MNEKNISIILKQVVKGDINKISTTDLEETLHWVSLGDLAGNQIIISAIERELEKRKQEKHTIIAERGFFWQKLDITQSISFSIITLIISIIAIIISILSYFKL